MMSSVQHGVATPKYFLDLLPGLTSDIATDLKGMGVTIPATLSTLIPLSLQLHRDSEALRTNDILTDKGKLDARSKLEQRRESLLDSLNDEIAELQTQSGPSYPEPSSIELAIILNSLTHSKLDTATTMRLWGLGGGYQGFVANHLESYANLNTDSETARTVTREVSRLTGAEDRQTAVKHYTSLVEQAIRRS